MDNKTFLSREQFLQNSNIVNPLLTNIFNVSIDDNETILERFNSIVQNKQEKNIYRILEQNAYSFTLNTIEAEFFQKFFNNSRSYLSFRRGDSNIQISFVESADQSIRRIFETWINLTMIDNPYGYYYDDVSTNIIFKPVNTSLETAKDSSRIFNNCIPVNVADSTLDLGGDATLPLVNVMFVYTDNRPFT